MEKHFAKDFFFVVNILNKFKLEIYLSLIGIFIFFFIYIFIWPNDDGKP
jgi:hypothetical protein